MRELCKDWMNDHDFDTFPCPLRRTLDAMEGVGERRCYLQHYVGVYPCNRATTDGRTG